MAGKSKKVKVVTLVAKDDKGKITFSYHTTKKIALKEKLELMKYNPVTRKHEKFVETKSK
ncbi:MAG TPA: 50S ribosomal protein L33 [Candidatus Gracilibacteria bacterium]|nr:50S ribosomal protein L33 [Candidatus Gracilibacteria bacterium]